ncbi:MAG: Gfo/Idh/MocA family oxidoreductase [Pirellulaceae bacterium]|nr:Gfo/Idh/MocA family oxidoreductase [Pirellulaceae bacterium]
MTAPPPKSFVRLNRRDALAASAFAGWGLSFGVHTSCAQSAPSRSAMNRLGVGAIGLRYQGSVIAHKAQLYGDITAVCDVDRNVRDQAKAAFGSTPYACEDYHDLIHRNDVDVVTIGSPDHWHTKMLIDACRAGKDVYCEKPLTLTIDEGKQLTQVVKETGRIVQVGSWQRSDDRFRLAVEMVRGGRLGRLQRVDVVLGKNATSDSFVPRTPPAHLNWNLWQGQTPDVPYIEERTHYTFRWWYEYSGGQMTDWGAHHLDIAQWAIDSYPLEIDGTATLPKIDNGYNVPIDFEVRYRYASGVVMTVKDTGDNGILFTGDAGRIFVNRGKIVGAPVENLAQQPFKRQDWRLYDFDNLDRPARYGKLDAIINHMGNFFDCIQSQRKPISDIDSQHRSVSTCHLANISMRLGRKLQWNPETEFFVNDQEADAMLKREQRHGFETM